MYKFYKEEYCFYPEKSRRKMHMQLVIAQQRWRKEHLHNGNGKWIRHWRKIEWSHKENIKRFYFEYDSEETN